LGPLTFGSGKLGTPCERMQLANASAPGGLLVAAGPLLPVVGLEEPQAPIATAQLTAATAIERPRRCRFAALLVVALRNGLGFTRARWIVGRRGSTAGGITRR
jgi:hypothetical protein